MCTILLSAKRPLKNVKICSRSSKGNTWSISRIDPPKFGGGLKPGPDTELGQRGEFCEGLHPSHPLGGLVVGKKGVEKWTRS